MKETDTIYKYIYKDNIKDTTDIVKRAIENHYVTFGGIIRDAYKLWTTYGLIDKFGYFKNMNNVIIDFMMDPKYGRLVDRLFDPDLISEIRITFNSPEKNEKVIYNHVQATRMVYNIDYNDIRTITIKYKEDKNVHLGPFPPIFDIGLEFSITYAKVYETGEETVQIYCSNTTID